MNLNDILKTEQAHVVYAQNQVPVIKFNSFEPIPWLSHGFSTRHGGVSKGIFESMNPSFSRGDDPEAAMENLRLFGQAVGMNYRDMVFSRQTHTTNIRRVDESDKGKGVIYPGDYTDVDGLMTDIPQIPLVTFYADCIPLFFADTVHKAIASSHSGWRGTAARMGKVTVEAMHDAFGTEPENLIAVVGPGICRSCYEVSADVAGAFMKEFRPSQWNQILEKQPARDGEDKYLLNLWEANRIILEEAGIPKENIHISGICPHCHPKEMWSHRTLGNQRGTLAGFMMIRE